MTELLFSYRFEQGKDIGNYGVLAAAAASIKLRSFLQPHSCWR
jgi:predicted DsbA family dithiol-disulfide isomerase